MTYPLLLCTSSLPCGRLLPLWTPHAVRLWMEAEGPFPVKEEDGIPLVLKLVRKVRSWQEWKFINRPRKLIEFLF
jgi:hypothetical protein